MQAHILNGDALTDRMVEAGFKNLVVCRECLVDGPVQADNIDAFWKIRADYISENIAADREKYYDYAVTEFDKLKELSADTIIHLWFGDDLFCQVNLWFMVSYLHQLDLSDSLYRVFPVIKDAANRWSEFGNLSPDDFRLSYDMREPFTANDIYLARSLWKAYQAHDLETLQSLATAKTNVFHDLDKVVQAHIERFPKAGELSRPEKILKEIMDSGLTDFNKIFPAFFHREGIYGFGDVQVKNILANMK